MVGDQQDEKRSLFLALASGPTSLFLCKPFSFKACPGIDASNLLKDLSWRSLGMLCGVLAFEVCDLQPT